MPLARETPTPRARRIYDEMLTLTVYDVLWIRDEILRLLGGEGGAATGVREPRRPGPRDQGGVVERVMYLTGDPSAEDVA